MPLPPLPPENTARYWLNYSAAGIAHSLQMRVAPPFNDAGALINFNALLDELDSLIATNVTFDGVDFAAAGSNVRNPVAGWTPRSGAGGFTLSGDGRALQLSFVGRSIDGRKVKFQMWGVAVPSDGDFRLEAGDSAALDGAIDVIEAGVRYWVTISGLAPVMHQYINYGFNDHTVRQLR